MAKAVAESSLRDVAKRIGLSYFVIYKITTGGTVRAATLDVVERWLEGPDEAARHLEVALRRAMKGLPKRQVVRVEGQVKRLIQRAYEEAGKEVPGWVTRSRSGR